MGWSRLAACGRRALLAGIPSLLALSLLGTSLPELRAATLGSGGATPAPDPVAVRQEALRRGLGSLATLANPTVDLTPYLRVGASGNVDPAALVAAQQLGKALFWDQQVGSDGQACGSCHFSAGADNRTKNALNPGNLAPTAGPGDALFGNPSAVLPAGTAGHPGFGPNATLSGADFPFHQLQDPGQQDYTARSVVRDTNDRVSSQGVFTATFTGIGQPTLDQGTPLADPVFSVGAPGAPKTNVRRVEPRNTPSMINALFNEANFWDGRANNIFNGVNPFGPVADPGGLVVWDGSRLGPATVRIANSSLASQAVGPPGNGNEMSFLARSFPIIGRKLSGLTPLGQQQVAATDSTLGPLSNANPPAGPGRCLGICVGRPVTPLPGLSTTYPSLIKAAFQPRWWNAPGVVSGTAGICPDGCSEMENNFSLFFGIAIQSYEFLLRADQSRFDMFMQGQDTLSADELRGLLVFMNRPPAPPREGINFKPNPIFDGVGFGVCANCHAGAALSAEGIDQFSPTGGNPDGSRLLTEVDEALKMGGADPSNGPTTRGPVNNPGRLVNAGVSFYQEPGFLNIGVRPSSEDLGRGGTAPNGKPLSLVREALEGDPYAPPLATCPTRPTPTEISVKPCPENNRVSVDGNFKVPQLRNVELTGPYFHNGGQATLKQVTEFYRRRGDFANVNIAGVDDQLAEINFSPAEGDLLVKFLLTLTDDRVRNQSAPFDQPQIFVPNGQPGDQNQIACATTAEGVAQACDARMEIPAVGAEGRAKRGLPPLTTFLNLSPLDPGSVPVPPQTGPPPARRIGIGR